VRKEGREEVMKNEFSGFTVNKIGKIYKVMGNNCPDDMEITVKKERGGYRAVCNYSLKRKNADTGYQAMKLCSTPEETIKHLLMSLQPGGNSSPEEWVKLSPYP
jgi:hypothetical protein